MQILMHMEWDIPPERMEVYSEFVRDRFIPRCNELGLESVGGFYVEVGSGPAVISVNRAQSLDDLFRIMSTDDFERLVAQLKDIVVGYRSMIMRSTGRVRRGTYLIQKGVWKYIRYWDIRPGKRDEYAEFVVSEVIPTLESLHYLEVTGGWHVLIGGHSDIVEELTFKDPVDIGALFDNPSFRQLTHVLRTQYVTNCSSRILRTTEQFDEPRWFAL
jgi:hypothetical protein